ncbi:MAG: hypothetical protein U9N45_04220 [Gemmatimonadota bacterium]|nr:hypothetical protein [Gemmatimonadota bacterium]
MNPRSTLSICLCFFASGLFSSPAAAETFPGQPQALEKLLYPHTRLCLLDVRGQQASYPFDMEYFRKDLLAYLRGAEWLSVKTEEDLSEALSRNRLSVPDTYEPRTLSQICRLADCDYTAFLRMITIETDIRDGFSIPVFFKRNKVTYSAELDFALLKGETGSLQYSSKVIGRKSMGRGVQVYPVTEDPSTHLSFREKEFLAREMMQDLARRTFESIMQGIKKPLSVKYICYWQDEVHIISDKPGLCPICGSRLKKIFR